MIENERKYIVNELPQKLPSTYYGIIQHYISFENPDIRIRQKGIQDYTMTVKTGGNEQIREETTISLTREQYNKLKEASVGVIRKTRYELQKGVTLDVFKDIDLMLLEIENSDLLPPEWAGVEVTGMPQYYNSNIAQRLLQNE